LDTVDTLPYGLQTHLSREKFKKEKSDLWRVVGIVYYRFIGIAIIPLDEFGCEKDEISSVATLNLITMQRS